MSGRHRIPGLEGKGEAGLDAVLSRFDKRLDAVGRRPTQRKTQTRDFFARENETITIEAPARGLNATLVRASKFNKGRRVTFIQLTAAPVTFRAVGGLVNGKPSVKSNAPGTYDAVSDGQNGWSLSQGITEQGVVGAEGTPGAAGATGPAGPPGATGAAGGGGAPATGSEDGYLSRIVYVDSTSARVATTFAGVTVEAAPASWTTDADIPDGGWFEIRPAGAGGGGAGANTVEGRSGPGGGGGARPPPRIYSRADLVAMLPIAISCGLGGLGGVGRSTSNGADLVLATAGGNGTGSSFGPFQAGGGSGGQVNTGRHGGTGGGVETAATPANSTTAVVGGAPSSTIGVGGVYLEGAGHPNTSAGAGIGLPAVHGGASGGSVAPGEASAAGGRAVYGGGGGGSGRGTNVTIGAGDVGGAGGGRWVDQSTSGGGGAGGPAAVGAGPPAAGSDGGDGDIDVNGDGGGGGGSNDTNTSPSMTAGSGGNGGFPGGAGGGGGSTRISTFTSRAFIGGDGGDGADGCIIITAYA